MSLPVKITALLADDELSVLKGLEQSIKWSDLGVELIGTATDGQEALRLILEKRPDFVIIDINMPGMSGLEVMKAVNENSLGTDFIILSGYNEFSYAQQAIRFGAKGYLLKPLDSAELSEQIRRICIERSSKHTDAANSQYLQQLTQSFFTKLINGKVTDSSSINQFLQTMNLSLSDEHSYVTVFSFDQVKELAQGSLENAIATINSNLQYEKFVLWQNDDNKLTAVFNSSETPAFQVALRILDILKGHDLPIPYCGIGDIVDHLANIPYSYSRAMTALTYRIYNEGQILSYENICTIPPSFQLSDIDCLPLIQHIVRQEKDEIKKFCEDFFGRLFYVETPPPNYVYSLCYALFSKIEKEFSGYAHEEIHGIANAQDLYHFQSVTEIRKWLFDTFCKLSDYVDALYGHNRKPDESVPEIESVDDEIIKKATAFINAELTSGAAIKIDDIARHVHLSSSYFAIYFKEKTGVNLRDHILRVRMEYAAHALIERKQSINEIAASIGYSDYRSFSRAFKNVYGCTPSDFQMRHQ